MGYERGPLTSCRYHADGADALPPMTGTETRPGVPGPRPGPPATRHIDVTLEALAAEASII
ncbi:hypothetical protein FHR81_003618 [Actinoalloteichus hoggarensis]|uniref:Uncharacterized protein n=1 Tax=Actinoalloteichus hoggarensis TaxID=1470176 RepID=A0A221WA69_9PSEU|nr:hypothetical protein AHOG_26800 [Actinoalloteichus hoggarensis]MBB5922561.1 hypothetical protein [Actinoalloteichus hoggarensis]